MSSSEVRGVISFFVKKDTDVHAVTEKKVDNYLARFSEMVSKDQFRT